MRKRCGTTARPITCADVEFTWQATLNTTGTLTTVGYDKIESIAEGDEPGSCVSRSPSRSRPGATCSARSSEYVLKADAFASDDIANDLDTEIPFSGGPCILESFDPTGEATFVRNEAYWDDETASLLDGFTMVAQADTDTELNSLLAGEVAAIYPQPAPGIADTLGGGETVEFQFGAGTTYEGLWFTHASLLDPSSELADPAVREALLFADRPRGDPRRGHHAELPRDRAAELRRLGPDGRRVVRPDGLRGRHVRPRPGRRAPHRGRLREGRRRLLRQGRPASVLHVADRRRQRPS